MTLRLMLVMTLALTGCVTRPCVTTELISYGTLPTGSAVKTLGVSWATDDEFPPSDRMILNGIAKIIVDDAKEHGQNAYFITSDADLKKLMTEQGLLVSPLYYMNERVSYVPPHTYTHVYPITTSSGGRVVTSASGRTTYYTGRTTVLETDSYSTGGYTIMRHCKYIELNYTTTTELKKEKPQVSYVQKLKNCGSDSDVRKVMPEMIETAFKYFGQEGEYFDTIYTDVPKNSAKRYQN